MLMTFLLSQIKKVGHERYNRALNAISDAS